MDTATLRELLENLREGFASQDCELCNNDSNTWVRCGRGVCAKNEATMVNAANAIEELIASAERCARLDAALREIDGRCSFGVSTHMASDVVKIARQALGGAK